MTRVKVSRSLFLSLGHHPGGIRFSGHSSWPELFPLLVILGLAGSSVIHLPMNSNALVIDLAAGFLFDG